MIGRSLKKPSNRHPSAADKASAHKNVIKGFYFGYGMTILLAAFAVGLAFIEQFVPDVSSEVRAGLTGGMVFVFAALILSYISLDCLCGGTEKYAAALGGQDEDGDAKASGKDSVRTTGLDTSRDELRSPILPADNEALEGGDSVEKAAVAVVRPDRTLRQAVASFDFYLIFVTLMLAGGAGMLLINNISQIVAAIPGKLHRVDTH